MTSNQNTSICFAVTKDGREHLMIVAEPRRDAKKTIDLAQVVATVGREISQAFGIELAQFVLIRPGSALLTSSGKRRRQATKRAFSDQSLAIEKQWSKWGSATSDVDYSAQWGQLAHYPLTGVFLEALAKVAQIEPHEIDPDSSLFHYGVDSLSILSLQREIELRNGTLIPIEHFFTSKSFREFVTHAEAEGENLSAPTGKVPSRDLEDRKRDVIALCRRDTSEPSVASHQNVLLTGASGYLGGFLLHNLLRETEAKVTCLVRAESPAAGMRRIEQNARKYGLEIGDRSSRVEVVIGDMRKPDLGLDRHVYERLCVETDTIYHSAALDNFYLPYDVMGNINVEGCSQVIEFACAKVRKKLHYISSCAISLVDDQNIDDDTDGIVNGYAKSKYVAEQLVFAAADAGLPAISYRLGYLYNELDEDKDPIEETDAKENILALMVALQRVPSVDFDFDYTGVNYAAKSIIEVARREEFSQREYVFYNPSPLKWWDCEDHGTRTRFSNFASLAVTSSYTLAVTALQPIVWPSEQTAYSFRSLPMDSHTVDVVVLSLERLAETHACIDSVLGQDHPNVRLFVIDQGSGQAVVESLKERARCDGFEFVAGERTGVAAGRNLGYRFGRAPLIVALDNDAVFSDRSVLSRVEERFAANPKLGALAFAVYDYESGKPDVGSWGYPWPVDSHFDREFLTARFCGAGHAVSRQAFEAAGGYDEQLFFFGEELDLSWSMVAQGYEIRYTPSISVRHRSSLEKRIGWRNGRYYYNVRNMLYLTRKYLRDRHLLNLYIGGYLLKGLFNGLAGTAIKGIRDGLRMVYSQEREWALDEAAKAYIHQHEYAPRGSVLHRFSNELLSALPRTRRR